MRPSSIDRQPVLVFDIGGTWFRTGVVDCDGQLRHVRRQASINIRNTPDTDAMELQQLLADYLASTARSVMSEFQSPIQKVSVSIGAPTNAWTGEVFESGPLWGDDCPPCQLSSLLSSKLDSVEWSVVNDVTAALAGYMLQIGRTNARKVMIITVSTGVGARLVDVRSGNVPVDRTFGIQGEIGHLPVNVQLLGETLDWSCDCGGVRHLNAFSSGLAIERMLEYVRLNHPTLWNASTLSTEISNRSGTLMECFSSSVKENDSLAISILESSVKPLADVLRTTLTIDPEIDEIVLTGGVAQNIGEPYLQILCDVFLKDGMYLISDRSPDFLSEKLRLMPVDDTIGMLGAAEIALDHFPDSNSIKAMSEDKIK